MTESSVCLGPRTFASHRRWLLIGLTAIGFFLRFHRLDAQSLWYDESLSALFASQPLHVAIRSMLEEGLHHSPLFYILIRPFAAEGFSEFGLRFIPATLGVLAIPLIAQVGRVLTRETVGLLAAALVTMSPFHVWYSQEGRMYTLLTIAALGATFFFVQNLKTARLRNWLGLALFTAIGINSHHFAFFVPLVQFLFLVVTLKQNYKLLRPWVGAQLLAAMSLIPWLIIVLDWGKFYLSSATRQPPTAYDVVQTFWNFTIGYTEYVTLFVVVALTLFVGLLSLGIRSTYRSHSGILLGLWLFVPTGLTFLVSLRLPAYLDRYIILSLPPFLLLVAIGLLSIERQVVRFAAAGLMTLFMLVGLQRVYYDTSVYNRADWRGLGAYLAEDRTADIKIALWDYQYLIPLSFYYAGPVPLDPIVSFDVVDLPTLPAPGAATEKLLVVIGHPNNSAHLVGHCQAFDMDQLAAPTIAKKWWTEHQDRLSDVIEMPCIRVEIYY
jgi:4-amino-4-deoxy-L-arabinose transferase-like glycosyltransferase